MNTRPDTDSCIDHVASGPGGAMTDEAGFITGDLTVRTALVDGGRSACVTVQYTGADEWDTLRAAPLPSPRVASRPTTVISSDTSAAATAPRPPRDTTHQRSRLVAGRSCSWLPVRWHPKASLTTFRKPDI
jgi:hypothetical protein